MRPTLVGDVMTIDVVSFAETTPYKEMVTTLVRRGVSGAPVVDGAHRPVGIVSETDLLAKEADPHAGAGHPLLEGRRRRAARRSAAGDDARSLMTPRPVTITADQPAAEAARRMRRHGVNRLPVTDDRGRLIGIVSRGDLLRAFLRSDMDIRRSVREGLLRRDWSLDPGAFLVEVRDGVVTISGEVEREAMAGHLCHDIASLDGVVRVDSLLTWRSGQRDAGRRSAPTLPW